MIKWAIFFLVSSVATAVLDAEIPIKRNSPRAAGDKREHCDVAIVGGGIAGLYTAESLLRHGKETNVCVFERDVRVGGRLYDYVFPQVPDESVGLGAWRIHLSNYNARSILDRLSIPYRDWNFYENPRIESRGQSSRAEQEIKEQSFPTLLQSKFQNMSWNEMHQYLFNDEHVNEASKFATFQTYQQHFLTPEGSEFYFDIFGYRSILRGDTAGILEFLKYLDEDFSKEQIRPVKGMSALTDALEESAKSLGAKIYTGNEIASINKRKKTFVLKTSAGKTITAEKLVVAAPPGSFKKIGGKVAKNIQQQEEFQSIKAFPAFKAAAVYPRAWWEDLTDERERLYPMERFLSSSECLGWTLPHAGRGKNGEAVLHLAYKDGECGAKWGQILNTVPKTLVDLEVHRAIEYKFNMTVPKPLETVYQYWDEGGWYFQRPGTNVSMKQVKNWAKRPFHNEQIYFVGSAYHFYRAYSEGALASANNALLEGWGIPIPTPPIEARMVKHLSKTRGTNLRMIF